MDEDECDLGENLGKDAGGFNCLIGACSVVIIERRCSFTLGGQTRGLFANLYCRDGTRQLHRGRTREV